ncbi:hypothetical protein GGS20DRAFT_587813 [Poronia punctata]|nr:hypothetical protein GGS20DRAFT_587813 [Poronia punctata]
MSDSGPKKWTEPEKVYFLVSMVDNMLAGGGKLPVANAVVPGRTPKALRGAWDKLRQEAAAYAAKNGVAEDTGAGPATPQKKRGGTKRSYATASLDDGEDNDDAGVPPTPGQKSPRKAPAKKKAKGHANPPGDNVKGSKDDETH